MRRATQSIIAQYCASFCSPTYTKDPFSIKRGIACELDVSNSKFPPWYFCQNDTHYQMLMSLFKNIFIFKNHSVTAISLSRFLKTGYCNLHCLLQFKLKRKKWNHRFLWREFQPFGISIHEIYTFPTNLHH